MKIKQQRFKCSVLKATPVSLLNQNLFFQDLLRYLVHKKDKSKKELIFKMHTDSHITFALIFPSFNEQYFISSPTDRHLSYFAMIQQDLFYLFQVLSITLISEHLL